MIFDQSEIINNTKAIVSGMVKFLNTFEKSNKILIEAVMGANHYDTISVSLHDSSEVQKMISDQHEIINNTKLYYSSWYGQISKHFRIKFLCDAISVS